MPGDKQTLDFKTAGMKRAANRDAVAQKGKQFGISNFFGWAMQKYPKMTLGQLEARMPALEREYGQEKAMRKAEPDMQPSVNSAFDDEKERILNTQKALEAEQLRAKVKSLNAEIKTKEEEFKQAMKRIESSLKFSQDANKNIKNDYDAL